MRTRIGLTERLLEEDETAMPEFSLDDAPINARLADALLQATASEFGHWSVRSQKLAFQSVRKLVAILEHEQIGMRLPLPSDTAHRIYNCLLAAELASATKLRLQRDIHLLLRWCQRNSPGVISRAATFTVPIFKIELVKEPEKLPSELLKSILSACSEEIEIVEARMARGRSLVAGNVVSMADMELALLLEELLALGGGDIPLNAQILRMGPLRERFNAAGGHRSFSEMLYLTFEGMFPFYLSVLARTSGNTEAIRDLKLNCIRPHPLRRDLEVLTWDKARAAREQQVDFPVGKMWSAPNLVRRVMSLNEPLRARCARGHEDRVFLALGLRTRTATLPVLQVLHTMLRDFISRHGLQDFDFEDLRPTGAKIHRIAGQSVIAAKKRLNHRNASTTERYTNPQDASEQTYARISNFQGQLLRGPYVSAGSQGSAQTDEASTEFLDARTVFGFDCKNPFAGLDGRTPKGARCVNFTQCANCPGSVVPVDEPNIVARILGARDALTNAKERAMREGWLPRFSSLYASTLFAICHDILPAVTPAVLDAAQELIQPHYVPYLD